MFRVSGFRGLGSFSVYGFPGVWGLHTPTLSTRGQVRTLVSFPEHVAANAVQSTELVGPCPVTNRKKSHIHEHHRSNTNGNEA